jgi:hypothetical protein
MGRMAGASFAGHIIVGFVGYSCDYSIFGVAPYSSFLKTGGLHALHFYSIDGGDFYFCCGGL